MDGEDFQRTFAHLVEMDVKCVAFRAASDYVLDGTIFCTRFAITETPSTMCFWRCPEIVNEESGPKIELVRSSLQPSPPGNELMYILST